MPKKHTQNNPYVSFDIKFSVLYEEIYNEIFIINPSKYSEFIENSSYKNVREDAILIKVLEYKNLLKSTNSLKNYQIRHVNSLNDAFALYLIWEYGKKDKHQMKKIISIVLLLRDFLNIFGWDLVNDFNKKKIEEEFLDLQNLQPEQEFTSQINENYLPLIIDDFIFPYLNPSFTEEEEFKNSIKSTIFDISKILQEESLLDFVIKPLNF